MQNNTKDNNSFISILICLERIYWIVVI